MTESAPTPVLARIIAAHAGHGPGRPDPTELLSRALSRAIRRAAMPFDGFSPVIGDVAVDRDTDLGALTDALPEHGLIAGLEDSDGRRGLVAVEHGLVDALIEVQATGAVEEAELQPRTVTRIDEALCRDFLDLIFGAFAKEVADAPARDWPLRMRYGTKVREVAQLNLLLPERAYHVLRTEVSVGHGRTGRFVFALPIDPGLVRAALPNAVGEGAPPVKPEAWRARVLAAVGSAPLSLDAVLTRTTLSLGEVQALEIGALVPFDPGDLGTVSLEGEGHVLLRGHLGQLRGKRAVRIGPPAAARAAVAAPLAAAPTLVEGTAPKPPAPPAPMPHTPDPVPAAPAAPEPAMEGVAMAGLPDLPAAPFDPDMPMPDEAALPDLPMAGFDPDAPMG